MKLIVSSIISSLALCACGSKGGGPGGGDPASCPAFELKVDGQPVTGFTTKMAFTHKRGKERIHQVQFFNHDKTTCAELTSLKGRTVPDGEVTIAAMGGGVGTFGSGVQMSSHGELGVEVVVLGDAPQKPGDTVSVCVPEKTFKPKVGEHADKAITIKGLMEGSWCGFMDWDAQ